MRSSVGSALSEISKTGIAEEAEILHIREQVTVICPEQEDATPCVPASTDITPCLFNITADPCETNNLADAYPEILEQLMQQFTGFWKTFVNQTNQPGDSAADPRKFNNVWSPWVTEWLNTTNELHDLCNPEVQCRMHKYSPIIPILSQINPLPRIDIYFLKVHFNIVLPSNPRPS